MSDLISREVLLEEIRQRAGMWQKTAEVFCEIIEKQPSVEAAPVVYGHWSYNHIFKEWECSECDCMMKLSDDENGHPGFCPNCGADMREGRNT